MIRRRKKTIMFVSVVAMGDIAFLLIIFFILVGNFMKDNMKFTPPVSMDVETHEAAQVTVVMDESREVWLQGVNIDIKQLADGVIQMVGDHRDRPVHVKIHKGIERKDFLPVFEALSEAGVKILLAGDKGDPN